jgi:ribosomal protein S27AE
LLAVSTLTFTGCWLHDDDDPVVQSDSVSGVVQDGYLVGATVCSDQNNNKICDAGEPTDTSGAGGEFLLTGVGVNTYPIIAEIGAGVFDEDNPGVPITRSYLLTAPAPGGNSVVVNAISSLVQARVEAGDLTPRATVAAMLGIDEADLLQDYLAPDTADEAIHGVAQVLTRAMGDIKGRDPEEVYNVAMAGMLASLDVGAPLHGTLYGTVQTAGPSPDIDAIMNTAGIDQQGAINRMPDGSEGLRSSYPGADDCKSCHGGAGEPYDYWVESGHGYKMNPVDGSVPIYPFSNVSAMFPYTVTNSDTQYAPEEMTVDNTAYVIGGYGWKGRYVDATGNIKHGANAQYNLATGTFTDYHDGEDDAPYDCGSCHTTGWDPDAVNQELTDMAGDMLYDAITCQRCHGDNTSGGVGHNTTSMAAGASSFLPTDTQGAVAEFAALAADHPANTVCSDCHVRGDFAAVVPVSGGLVRHHEQSQELYVGGHGNILGCVSCHDPHASVKYDSLAKGEGVLSSVIVAGNCTVTCHQTQAVDSAYAGHTCVDCHMPYLVKSALSFTSGIEQVPGVTALGIPGGARGDIRSHVFSLTSTSDATALDADLDGTTAPVHLPVDFSCMTCHGADGTVGPTTASDAVTLLISKPVHPTRQSQPQELRTSYPGADDCKGCHSGTDEPYDYWVESGHGYKMNPVNGSVPIYPFSEVSNMFPHYVVNSNISYAIEQMTVDNTAYVIGGYGWKGRYVDATGNIKHGANAQYNLATGTFTAYHDGEDDAPYDCGSCHTTGWDPEAVNQELTDMAGDMLYDAITCQRCHGDNTSGGAGHNTTSMAAGASSFLPTDTQGAVAEFAALGSHPANTVCSDCHVRGDFAAVVPVSGGLVRHHEQSQELYVGGHGNILGCVSCHDPHASVKYDSQAKGEGVLSSVIVAGNCTVSCHATKTVASVYAGHTCVDCHMPYLVKSALSFTSGIEQVPGVSALGIPGGVRGDIRSHVFSLTSTSDATALDADLDGTTAPVRLPVDFSCLTCHGADGTVGPTTAAEAATMLNTTSVHP